MTTTNEWIRTLEAELESSCNAEHLRQEREARKRVEAKVQELDSLLTYSLQHSEKFREWADAEVEKLRDAMRKIQDLAVIKANKCLGCAASEEEAYRALNPTDK